MTSTPDQLARKLDRLPREIKRGEIAGVTAGAQISAAAARALGRRGHVPAPPSQIRAGVGRIGRNGEPFSIVYAFGFATLAERGSYHKPDGWIIKPRKSGIAQVRAKRNTSRRDLARARASGRVKVMLGDVRNPKNGDGSTGFAAAFAPHKPFKARPYFAAAAAATSGKVGATIDRITVQRALGSVFGL